MDNQNFKSTAPQKKPKKQINSALLAVIAGVSVLAILTVVLLVVLLPHGEESRSDDPALSGTVEPARLNEELKKFEGYWVVDSITQLQFDGKGNGVMYTAVADYTFTYTVMDNQLILKCDSEKSYDGYYSYVMRGDSLTMSRGSSTWNLKRK